MAGLPQRDDDPTRLIHRRAWLAAAAASLTPLTAHGDEQKPEPKREPRQAGLADDEATLQVVEDRARKLGLAPLGTSRTANYSGIGDAPEAFRTNALRMCEDVARDYFAYYDAEGFDFVHRPLRRLVVVTLADRKSFSAFRGVSTSAEIGGYYDRKSNALFVYDHRVATEGKAVAVPRYHNQIALAHEATHQLTYNTGMLEREGDVPLAIVEGLAMYGELRKTSGRSTPGMLNQDRLRNLAYLQRQGLSWIGVDRLLGDDQLLKSAADSKERLLAYAESWLLTYMLMKDTARQPAFRSYLRAIAPRRDATKRLDDLRAQLGDLERLNQELKRYAVRLLKET